MKVQISNNIIIQRIASDEPDLCSFCYFTKYHIDCFEDRYDYLHGCFKALSYYSESNSNDSLFKL